MPVPFTPTQMKAWLETGDFPTQQQFADIIDTFSYQNQQALDTAEATLEIAESFPMKAAGYVKLGRPGGSGPVPTAPPPDDPVIYRENGCSVAIGQVLTNTSGAPTYTMRLVATVTVTFDTAQPDAHFAARVSGSASDLGNLAPSVATLVSKSTTELVFTVTLDFGAAAGLTYFVLFEVF